MEPSSKQPIDQQFKISLISGSSALIAHVVSGVFYPLELLKFKLQGIKLI